MMPEYVCRQSLPAVSTVTAAEHEKFIAADKLVVVAYVDSDKEALVSAFTDAAEAHRDDYLFALSTDPEAIKARWSVQEV
jgi:protein disulfide-isomerase A1